MTSARTWTRLGTKLGTRLATGAVLSVGLGVMLLGGTGSLDRGLMAQARGPVQRIVQGRVEDKDGAVVMGAIVYLKDGRTASVKSAIVDDKGSYRFVQLSQNTDYELWARSGEKKSGSKTISSFDSKNDITINLKID